MRAHVVALFAVLPGCGDDDCCSVQRDAAVLDAPRDAFVVVDAPPANRGFVPTPFAVGAFDETSPGTFTATTLDLSCLGTQRVDTPTSAPGSLTVTVEDFQSGSLVPSATLSAFDDLAYSAPFATATADGSAEATITIPTGTERHGFVTQHADARATYTLDLRANPSGGSQLRTLISMSNATVATLPALVGQTQIAGSALVLGRLYDCSLHLLSNFIATISSVPGQPIHLQDATTFYFNSSVGLPSSHSSRPAADSDGRFMILHVPVAATAYLQMWGYPNASDVSTQTLRLLAEMPITTVASGVFVTGHDPRRLP